MNNLRINFEELMATRYTPKWKTEMLECAIDELYYVYCSGFVKANDNLINFVSAAAIIKSKT